MIRAKHYETVLTFVKLKVMP